MISKNWIRRFRVSVSLFTVAVGGTPAFANPTNADLRRALTFLNQAVVVDQSSRNERVLAAGAALQIGSLILRGPEGPFAKFLSPGAFPNCPAARGVGGALMPPPSLDPGVDGRRARRARPTSPNS